MSKIKKNIHKSFDEGTKGEEIVRQLFKSAGFTCEKSDGKLYHDLVVNESFHVEVKYDIMSMKTGNVAIEYFNSKKCTDSGIASTKADYWAHICFLKSGEQQVWISKVEDLRKWLSENKPKKTIMNGGDDNACLYIYGIEDIFGDNTIFRRIDNAEITNFNW